MADVLLPLWLTAPHIDNGSLSLLFSDYASADTPGSVVRAKALTALAKICLTLENLLMLSQGVMEVRATREVLQKPGACEFHYGRAGFEGNIRKLTRLSPLRA